MGGGEPPDPCPQLTLGEGEVQVLYLECALVVLFSLYVWDMIGS